MEDNLDYIEDPILDKGFYCESIVVRRCFFLAHDMSKTTDEEMQEFTNRLYKVICEKYGFTEEYKNSFSEEDLDYYYQSLTDAFWCEIDELAEEMGFPPLED